MTLYPNDFSFVTRLFSQRRCENRWVCGITYINETFSYLLLKLFPLCESHIACMGPASETLMAYFFYLRFHSIQSGCYRGQYKLGMRSGFGSRTSASYECHQLATEQQQQQTGAVSCKDMMQIYEGEWQNDRRQGYGIIKCIDSFTYYGQWVGNTRTGYGVLVFEGGVKQGGQWQNGRLIVALKRKVLGLKSLQLESKVQVAHAQALQAADAARKKTLLARSRALMAIKKAEQAQAVVETALKSAKLARKIAHKGLGRVSKCPFVATYQLCILHHFPQNHLYYTRISVPYIQPCGGCMGAT